MIAKQKEKLIAEIKQALINKGFIEDSFGNFVFTAPDGTKSRYKFGKTSLRREWLRIWYNEFDNKIHREWVRSSSGYYSTLSLTTDGRIVGLKP